MLAHTFRHLEGIGAKKELALWQSGIMSWDDLESKWRIQSSLFRNVNDDPAYAVLESSRRALSEGWVEFFADRLPREEHYRIALSFPAKTIFLDIETTGLSIYYDKVTLVGWTMGTQYQAYVAGDDDSSLRRALSEARAIVTFNGSLFDLPFLRKYFPGVAIPAVHVDLRFLARRVGLSGGQKNVEQLIGIKRSKALRELRGENAPILWHRYKHGDIQALELLLSYNHADVEGMKGIFDAVVKRLLRSKKLPARSRPLYFFAEGPSQFIASFGAASAEGEVRLVPYRGRTGPAIKLGDLLLGTESRDLRIVGIDPTGSEARPSGWCVIEGNQVVTRRIATDDELLAATLAARPDLVSIDSPLSLPKGRTVPGDDDPERARHGITRECERTLKKRGVNVYPCLIRSMQALTARGIHLTETLRHQGVPVIESYPGAAQDILGIPRKRASLEFLKTGLTEFGLAGEFETNEVSHDELDAITSALVGLLFWGGRFEALGNSDEGYLIIPDITVDPRSWRNRRVIGLSGSIGVGKTTAGRFLEGLGFHYGRYSMVLAKILLDRGVEPTRQALQTLGEKVNQGSQRSLGTQLLQMLPSSGNLVIDGLRHPEDHALLVETYGPSFKHVHVEALLHLVVERHLASGGNVDELNAALDHPVEANVPVVASLAHANVRNDSTFENLFAQLKTVATSAETTSSSLCQ